MITDGWLSKEDAVEMHARDMVCRRRQPLSRPEFPLLRQDFLNEAQSGSTWGLHLPRAPPPSKRRRSRTTEIWEKSLAVSRLFCLRISPVR
jgi:hypothetical protein